MTQAIQNLGAIDKLRIPEDWVPETRTSPDISEMAMPEIVHVFHSTREPRAQICIYFRNEPVTDASATAFRRVLADAPHKLTQQEIDSMQQVIGRMHWDEVFAIRDARTETVSGKVVLVVEGTWKGVDIETQCFFVDITGKGHLVQEIYYAAPKDVFDRFKHPALTCLYGVQWRSP